VLCTLSSQASSHQASSQESATGGPFLSHGSFVDDQITLTIRSDRNSHCFLFWGISEGKTTFNLPNNLGGRVNLGISPVIIFASTLDGSISLDSKNQWSFKLKIPRGIFKNLFFQAVNFQLEGSVLKAKVSNLLQINVNKPNEPLTSLQKAIEISQKNGKQNQNGVSRSGFSRPYSGSRRISTHLGTYHYDPFGNRVLRPRILPR
jgi:hypothetical protein